MKRHRITLTDHAFRRFTERILGITEKDIFDLLPSGAMTAISAGASRVAAHGLVLVADNGTIITAFAGSLKNGAGTDRLHQEAKSKC